ncbi:MAG: hypothetical protein JWS10_522 [Cypionkella sp.]|nr:hypothetical protein [Cypionkella sp.]
MGCWIDPQQVVMLGLDYVRGGHCNFEDKGQLLLYGTTGFPISGMAHVFDAKVDNPPISSSPGLTDNLNAALSPSLSKGTGQNSHI